jgi:hypothetical protein
MEGLIVGAIVHFVLDQGRNKGEHRPAIVVRVWDKDTGSVQLQVFTDDSNDDLPGVVWRTSVMPDPDGQRPYSWHWIEPA